MRTTPHDDLSWPEQWENFDRVAEKLAPVILAWWDWRIQSGQRHYHVEELRRHCVARCGPIAPGSADRVMRDLRRNKHLIAYRVADRRASLYEILDLPVPREPPEYDPLGQGLLFGEK